MLATRESPTRQPFLGSPVGTPRTLTRSTSYGGACPVDQFKAALVSSRNELVMLFTRWVGGGSGGGLLVGQGQGQTTVVAAETAAGRPRWSCGNCCCARRGAARCSTALRCRFWAPGFGAGCMRAGLPAHLSPALPAAPAAHPTPSTLRPPPPNHPLPQVHRPGTGRAQAHPAAARGAGRAGQDLRGVQQRRPQQVRVCAAAEEPPGGAAAAAAAAAGAGRDLGGWILHAGVLLAGLIHAGGDAGP